MCGDAGSLPVLQPVLRAPSLKWLLQQSNLYSGTMCYRNKQKNLLGFCYNSSKTSQRVVASAGTHQCESERHLEEVMPKRVKQWARTFVFWQRESRATEAPQRSSIAMDCVSQHQWSLDSVQGNMKPQGFSVDEECSPISGYSCKLYSAGCMQGGHWQGS